MNDESASSSSWLVHQWVSAGIISAGARFVPIPFVDEQVQKRCRRFVVQQTLVAHRSRLTSADLASFYSTDSGCLGGCLGMVVRAPLKLLLFPIRKIVTIFTSVRGVPLEIMRTVLIGRTLDRYLETGWLSEATLKESGLPSRALQMRTAFEIAYAQMDWRTLRAAMSDALGTVDQWKAAAVSGAKKVFTHNEEAVEQTESNSAIEASANKVQSVLKRSETLALFAEFDRRFDEAIQDLRKNVSP